MPSSRPSSDSPVDALVASSDEIKDSPFIATSRPNVNAAVPANLEPASRWNPNNPSYPALPPPNVRINESVKLNYASSESPEHTLSSHPSPNYNYQLFLSSTFYKIGGNGGGGSNAQKPPLRRAQQRKRSLMIHVVGAPPTSDRIVPQPPEPLCRPASATVEDISNPQFENSSDIFESLDCGVVSPPASLNIVWQDFSRYPCQKRLIDFFGSAGSLGSDTPYSVPEGLSGEKRAGNCVLPLSVGHSDVTNFPDWNEKEDDDAIHNPTRGKRRRFKLCSCRSWKQWICLRLFALVFIILGVLSAGVLYPILANIRVFDEEGPMERLSPFDFAQLKSIRISMIDSDTPTYAMTRDSVLGRGKLKLVFSDEFERAGRTFYPGEDQFWTAPRLHYGATNDLEMYDPDAITTQDGTLQIRFQNYEDGGLSYRSGMLQSWNKLCFKGGVMEVSVSLAGPGGIAGLWPGIWSLGNLARPGYRASSDGIWPYTYDQCDVGITPNQSSTDGISFLPGQRLAKCVCKGEDHPSPGTGRGAPEIDVLEGTINYDMKVGEATQSSQIAPFDIWYQPDYDYVAINNHSVIRMNGWQGGPFQQAISGVTILNNDWYDGKQYQKYAFEYIPGKADGAIAWFVGDEETFRITGNTIGPNGNIGQRDISQEPMSIVLNLAMSKNWAWIDFEKLGPRLAQGTVMRFDYVRIYQEEGKESITCDPPGYPTTKYIAEHPRAYDNANLTRWDGRTTTS